MRLTVSIFDHDRHTKITEIANAKIPLKDVKLLIISDEPIKMSVDLNDVKQVCSIQARLFLKLCRYKAKLHVFISKFYIKSNSIM